MAKTKVDDIEAVADGDAPRIVLRKSKKGKDPREGKFLLFALVDDESDAKPLEFWADRNVDWRVRIRAAKIQGIEGKGASMAYMLSAILGQEAFDTLMDIPELDEQDMATICEYAAKIVFGGEEGKALMSDTAK